MQSQLQDELAARCGLVCLVGAGGKKTTLYRLASAHPGRVGVTSTVYIPPFPESLEALRVIADEPALTARVVQAAATAKVVAFARPSGKRGRLAGLLPAQVAQIHAAAGFDVTLIKADGARSRWIKAPQTDEPQVPEGANTVIPVVSAHAIGEPLEDRVAHRVDRIAALIGIEPGQIITAEHVAQLLANPQGALKGTGTATVVPLINMVDDRLRRQAAREAAEQALALSERFDHIVLASMRRSDPLVSVVRR